MHQIDAAVVGAVRFGKVTTLQARAGVVERMTIN